MKKIKNKYGHLTSGNRLKFLFDGPEYNHFFLETIRSAQKSIHLQVYILGSDTFGLQVMSELVYARRRGVEVYLLIDSMGSHELGRTDEEKLRACGIHFCRFNPVIRWKAIFKWGRRLHHKILLIDDERAITGGINVVGPYVDNNFDNPKLDFALYLEGPLCAQLSSYCREIFSRWYRPFFSRQKKIDYGPEPSLLSFEDGEEAKISLNDWVRGRKQISREYMAITKGAQKRITIINSYFFPRKKFIKALIAAARRGVEVRLILPKHSDWPSWVLASQYLYREFLSEKIKIYQWKKSVLHGKLATVDGGWSTIGSFNLNYTSYQGNLEMNIDILSANFARHLEEKIDAFIESGCEEITPSHLTDKFSFKTQLKQALYYLLLSLISNFSLAFIFQDGYIAQPSTSQILSVLRIVLALFLFLIGIIGLFTPGLPGFPFLLASLVLVSRQMLYNRK